MSEVATERQPMNDGGENQRPQRTPEALAAEPDARKQGWVPLEQYRSNPDEWVDADEFLRRGKEINPILRANNRKLEEDLRRANEETARLKAHQETQDQQLKQLLEVNEEVAAEARKTMRAKLVAELAEAHEAGNPTKIAEATAALTEHTATPAPVKVEDKPVVKPAGPTQEQVRQYTEAVAQDFPWFAEDAPIATGMRATMGQVMRQMQADGRIAPGMDMVAATKLAAAETEKMYNVKPTAPSKVGSGRPSGAGPGPNKSFADLPPDAKAAADRSLKRMQASGAIGKDKTWADADAYRSHYVKQFAAQGGFDS